MATANPFDLLGDADVEDPTAFLAAQEQKAAASAAAGGAKKGPAGAAVKSAGAAVKSAGAKFPAKPQPPSQAVREARSETGRGGVRGYGRGRGPSGPNRELANGGNTLSNENGTAMGFREDRERPYERRGGYGGPRGGFRGGRRGGFSNGEADEGERPRRVYERRSGTGRGGDIKRDGSGRGNWGTPADEIAPETEEPVVEGETNPTNEKQPEGEENGAADKDNAVNESEEKETEPEEKQMTLEEYEKVLEEKRKALESLKVQERKVDVDKEFESMQLVSKKKDEEEVFIKLGSDKDKRKEAAEKEERAKKAMSINEFLKPAEGESYYRPGGRGRGRGGRGRGGGYTGGYSPSNNLRAPAIQDPSQFPSLKAN